jgi:hypothetical protein
MADPRTTPAWSTPWEACTLFLRGATASAAWKVAVVVGIILSAVNQGGTLFEGRASALTWVRVLVNFAVPYVVSSIGFLAACREEAELPE